MNLVQKTLLASFLSFSATSAHAIETGVSGVWTKGGGDLVVNVQPCNGDKICVKIVNIKKAFHDDGTPRLDDHNPNPALRSRPVVGLQIINSMGSTGPNTWKGKLYNSDDGKTYTAYAKLQGNALEVKGCWGPFCKTLNFAR